ncbi:MAG: hypothetical protein WAU88_00515 [Candidatus Zixiibacteriota bacterium]
MKKILFAVAMVLVIGSSAFAQLSDMATLKNTQTSQGLVGVKPASNPWSLLDLSRIKWSNSYSVSYFSGGGGSGSAGMLRSNMFYEFSPKLSMSVNLGLVHNLGGVYGDANSRPTILPGFSLDYHPSSKFQMSISVQRVSGMFAPGYGYWGYPYFGY